MTTSRPKIIITHGPTKLRFVPLAGKPITIGRASDNRLVLPDQQVSRYHAKITCSQMQYRVMDLHSRNGTFVNDKRLEPQQHYSLSPGDKIRIARNVALLEFDDPFATRAQTTEVESAIGLVIDPECREVCLDGRILTPRLSPQQFDFLLLLSQGAGKVSGREEVVARVWPDIKGEAVSEEMIDALAARVRKRLRELDPTHEFVVTVRGYGFKFVPQS